MKKTLVTLGMMLALSTTAQAELVQQFKNPAFSGIGFSSHVLTIDSIEKSRRDAIEADKKAAIAKAEAELLKIYESISKSSICSTCNTVKQQPIHKQMRCRRWHGDSRLRESNNR
jgi:hypothetical protein